MDLLCLSKISLIFLSGSEPMFPFRTNLKILSHVPLTIANQTAQDRTSHRVTSPLIT